MKTNTRRKMSRHVGRSGPRSVALATVVLLFVPPDALAGQSPGERAADAPEVAPLHGIVVDAVTGTRLEGARVQIVGNPRGTLTDSAGTFRFDAVPTGPQRVLIEHYGFEGLTLSLSLEPEPAGPFRILLTPLPVMLEGLEVVTGRLELMEARMERRRLATGSSVRSFELARLTTSPSPDLLDFLRFESSLHTMPCERVSLADLCVFRRGRPIRPRVFIDEVPAIGGIDQLSTYRPQDFYLVEVYASGLQIRAYTHYFMERMARQPVALRPIFMR